jgi:predicted ArsR family transcriptional regulator
MEPTGRVPMPTADSLGPGPRRPADGAHASEGNGTLRHAILLRLRQGGPASPDRLAADLNASRTGVLQQLRALESTGLVTHQPERHGVGRPRHRYDVTEAAQALFPANYESLAQSLVGAISQVGGPELVDAVFAARRAALAERAERHLRERAGPDAPLVRKVRELAVFQDEQGYLAETSVGEDGTVRLHQHNCAIHRVAAGEPSACEAELALFRELLGPDVVRETHIASGDRSCTYRVGNGAPSGDPSGDPSDGTAQA